MSHSHKQRGISLIGAVVASLIAALGIIIFSQTISASRNQIVRLGESGVAEEYATELLEFFLSMSPDRLRNYLATNPCNAPNTCDNGGLVAPASCTIGFAPCPAYQLCSHINILDRDTGNLLNEDPITTMPPSLLDNFPPPGAPTAAADIAKYRANRWYQIQIVHMTDLVPRRNLATNGAGTVDAQDICTRTPAELLLPLREGHTLVWPAPPTQTVPGGRFAADIDDRFFISVGVSWIPKAKRTTNPAADVQRIVLTSVLAKP